MNFRGHNESILRAIVAVKDYQKTDQGQKDHTLATLVDDLRITMEQIKRKTDE